MGARARSFPHVEGNYATHVRAPAGAMARDGALGAALRALGDAFPELEECEALTTKGPHASLSRVFPIRREDWNDVYESVRRELASMRPFEAVFDALRVFTNDDGTRAFVAAGFREGTTSESKTALIDAIDRVNAAIEPLGFPRYYDDPDPHVSLLWVAGASDETVRALRESVESIDVAWRLDVNRIVCEISGQPPKTVWGRVPNLAKPDL